MSISKKQFIETLQDFMGKFSSNLFIKSISNGMIRLLPITMVGSICAIMSNLGIPVYQKFIDNLGLTPVIKLGTTMTTNLISLYVLIALSYEMSNNLKKSAVISILLAIMSFFIITPLGSFEVSDSVINAFDILYLGSKGMFVAMIVALLIPYLYSFFVEKNITIKLPENVPPSVSNSFTALIPAILIGGTSLFITGIFVNTSYGNVHDCIYTLLQLPLQSLGGSIGTLLFLMFLSEFLWFFGIHGSLATSAILYTLYQVPEIQNLEAFSSGTPLPNIITMTFINTLKGPRHFALALLLLFICKSAHLKSIGKLSIVPGFFGISEPMKFGIPMVLNPVLFIPMSLAPVISIGIAYIATSLEWIPRANGVTFPWNIPFFSGLVIGDWRTGVLQIIQIVIIMVLYYPFIHFLDKQNLEGELI